MSNVSGVIGVSGGGRRLQDRENCNDIGVVVKTGRMGKYLVTSGEEAGLFLWDMKKGTYERVKFGVKKLKAFKSGKDKGDVSGFFKETFGVDIDEGKRMATETVRVMKLIKRMELGRLQECQRREAYRRGWLLVRLDDMVLLKAKETLEALLCIDEWEWRKFESGKQLAVLEGVADRKFLEEEGLEAFFKLGQKNLSALGQPEILEKIAKYKDLGVKLEGESLGSLGRLFRKKGDEVLSEDRLKALKRLQELGANLTGVDCSLFDTELTDEGWKNLLSDRYYGVLKGSIVDNKVKYDRRGMLKLLQLRHNQWSKLIKGDVPMKRMIQEAKFIGVEVTCSCLYEFVRLCTEAEATTIYDAPKLSASQAYRDVNMKFCHNDIYLLAKILKDQVPYDRVISKEYLKIVAVFKAVGLELDPAYFDEFLKLKEKNWSRLNDGDALTSRVKAVKDLGMVWDNWGFLQLLKSKSEVWEYLVDETAIGNIETGMRLFKGKYKVEQIPQKVYSLNEETTGRLIRLARMGLWIDFNGMYVLSNICINAKERIKEESTFEVLGQLIEMGLEKQSDPLKDLLTIVHESAWKRLQLPATMEFLRALSAGKVRVSGSLIRELLIGLKDKLWNKLMEKGTVEKILKLKELGIEVNKWGFRSYKFFLKKGLEYLEDQKNIVLLEKLKESGVCISDIEKLVEKLFEPEFNKYYEGALKAGVIQEIGKLSDVSEELYGNWLLSLQKYQWKSLLNEGFMGIVKERYRTKRCKNLSGISSLFDENIEYKQWDSLKQPGHKALVLNLLEAEIIQGFQIDQFFKLSLSEEQCKKLVGSRANVNLMQKAKEAGVVKRLGDIKNLAKMDEKQLNKLGEEGVSEFLKGFVDNGLLWQ